jgi:hypothetical protein
MSSEIYLKDIQFTKSNLIIPWKGKTFNQITSLIQMNSRGDAGTLTPNNYFRALPIKLPRREIVTSENQNSLCNPRISSSIDVFDRPGGSIINSNVTTNNNGLDNTIDNTLPNNTCEYPGTCLAFTSPSENAKRRVRSAGMIKRQFDISRGNDVSYFVNKKQYLISRSLTFEQNQYNYIRQGNATVKPGDALSSQNIYSSQGLSHCPRYFLPVNVTFKYEWITTDARDTTTTTTTTAYYDVVIPSGYYLIEDINNLLHITMQKNTHFFINNANKTKVFAIYFAYNSAYNKMELHSLTINNENFDTTDFSKQYTPGWDPTVFPPAINEANRVRWIVPNNANSFKPSVEILNNAFCSAVGFSPGIYTSANPQTQYNFRTISNLDNVVLSQQAPGIQPVFKTVIYKPSNPQFASQGGVSASSATARARYNTITSNTTVYNNAYGPSVANALAYGVPENGYTIKNKIGYPLRRTPRFPPLSYVMKCETCNTWNTHNSTKLT